MIPLTNSTLVVRPYLVVIRSYASKGGLPSRFKLSKATIIGSKDGKFKDKAIPKKHGISSTGKPSKYGNKSTEKPSTFKFGEFGGLKKDPNEKSRHTKHLLDKVHDFESLKLLPITRSVIQNVIAKESIALKNKDISDLTKISPTPIQTVTIKRLSQKLAEPDFHVYAIAADTGSGKTMAYLIPLVDYLLRSKADESIPMAKAGIHSVILVPTYELIQQVYETLNELGKEAGLNVYKWDNETQYGDLLEHIKHNIDIMVTTPNKLMSIYNIKMITRPDRILSNIKFAVVDEADTLMDPSWLDLTLQCTRQFKNMNHLVLCSATIPNEFNKTLTKLFPTAEVITTPRLHKLAKRLEFKIIDSTLNPFKGSKIKTLSQILYSIRQDNTEPGFEKRCIVFVNEKSEVKQLAEKLTTDYKLECIGLSSENTIEERLSLVKEFLSEPKRLSQVPDNSVPTKIKQTECVKIPGSNVSIPKDEPVTTFARFSNTSPLKILICTDLLARGLNFQGVRNVVLYDVPKTSIDLVHRVGRTARMSQSGRVFMITDKKTKSWAKGLPKVIKNNITLV
ncbi:ATP-dependent RNA helicase Mrh4p, mitochondrial [Monosporozyma unispora]|nr:RNA helicase [Kazachstania unispora]